jgi:hypothetical protein
MGDDNDYQEERPSIPTFSDGSYTNRGAKSSADASRISASKNTLAVASRASAMMSTSIKQLKYNTTPIVPKNMVNRTAVQAAEKRAQYILQKVISPQCVPNIKTTSQNDDNNSTTDISVAIYPSLQLVDIKETNILHVVDKYKDIVIATSIKKKILVEDYIYNAPKIFKDNRKVLLVKSASPNPGEIDPSFLSTLSTNLLNILNIQSDNTELLNEFDRHTLRVRISLEEPIHKSAVEKARINKNTYFTSDA